MPRGSTRQGDGGAWRPADEVEVGVTTSQPTGTRASGAREPAVSSPTSSSGVTSSSPGFDPLYGGLPYYYVIELYNPDTGQIESFYYGDLVTWGDMPAGLDYDNYGNFLPAWSMEESGGGSGGSGGRSGGSAAVGPVYVKPDERMVRESVKGMLASLAGTVNPAMLDDLTSTYMSEHKRAWSVRESEQVDPMETVKAKIRATSEYKTIHALRPESVDEYDWISSRQGALKRAGVSDIMAEQLGVAQATVGASEGEAATAGNIATFNQSGQQLNELKGRIRSAAYGALRLA